MNQIDKIYRRTMFRVIFLERKAWGMWRVKDKAKVRLYKGL